MNYSQKSTATSAKTNGEINPNSKTKP